MSHFNHVRTELLHRCPAERPIVDCSFRIMTSSVRRGVEHQRTHKTCRQASLGLTTEVGRHGGKLGERINPPQLFQAKQFSTLAYSVLELYS